jgi:arsenate reductase
MATDFPITIHHNANCGTSRNTLAMIRESGREPVIHEYVKTGWTRAQLTALLKAMGKRPRDILRTRGTPAEELGLLKPGVSDEAILAAMQAHPILVERPIVETPKGVRLCRPAETVRDLL